MRFVFSRRFFILLAAGFIPLSLSWNYPFLRSLVLAYDVLLIAFALVDYFISRRLPEGFTVTRSFERRFAIGDEAQIRLRVENDSPNDYRIIIKDEFPPEMILSETREADLTVKAETGADFFYLLTPPKRGNYKFGRTAVRWLSRFGLIWCQSDLNKPQSVKVYPNMRRAREIELKALGARSYLAIQRKSVRRGEGREFESMRDYVRGDELRHISWTATARRSRLTTRQYQIERDQNIIIALDAGRLMTGRIGDETKFDTAIHAALALMSASSRGGDNCGLVVFGRKIKKYLPPKKGFEHIEAVLETLHDLEPELIEPSYARAFQFIASNSKKRSFVVILTDLVDKDSSKELLNSLKLLRPRHLPLVVTIGDRDLNAAVSRVPKEVKEVFTQSAAEEIIHQRESALRMVETIGGLALDVTTQTLAPRLLETYLRVKERGLL
ncbi:MAG: vWA domain-containing protein [Acidobacteria bacterium]|nr:vWA domain-containing protein [Acidobacteriota bacterium]